MYTQQLQEIEKLWHTWFEADENEYSEMEASDIEYFIGVLLYNHFDFALALPNLKTMEIANDFYKAAGSSYTEVQTIINNISFESDEKAMEFLYTYVTTSQQKYTVSERYLLNRLLNHIDALYKRIKTDEKPPSSINFNAAPTHEQR
jgi:hypothetical protein